MIRSLVIAAAILALPAVASSALADEQKWVCLNKAEQNTAISLGKAVTLGTAIRSARGSVHGGGTGEVVKARLCRDGSELVYLLTVLARDGKVTHTAVDATSGKVVDAR